MNYVATKDVAKMIRVVLKEAFPKQKFSVRSDSNSININWVNGPTESMVNSFVSRFKSESFDGMIDMAKSNKITLDGQEFSFMSRFIFCHRDVDDQYKKEIENKYGWQLNNCQHYEYKSMMKEIRDLNLYGDPKESPTAQRIVNVPADFSDHY